MELGRANLREVPRSANIDICRAASSRRMASGLMGIPPRARRRRRCWAQQKAMQQMAMWARMRRFSQWKTGRMARFMLVHAEAGLDLPQPVVPGDDLICSPSIRKDERPLWITFRSKSVDNFRSGRGMRRDWPRRGPAWPSSCAAGRGDRRIRSVRTGRAAGCPPA